MSEPARAEPPRPQLDVRVGSATNALQPIPGRALARGRAGQWLVLALVAVAAAAGDQLTKAGRLEQARPRRRGRRGRAVHDPPRAEHGIAFGLFSDATSIVIALTAVAVACARASSSPVRRRHPLLPVGARARPRGQRLEPRRPRPARTRHRLPRPRLLARVQPRGHVHRGRGRAALRLASSPPTARAPGVGISPLSRF